MPAIKLRAQLTPLLVPILAATSCLLYSNLCLAEETATPSKVDYSKIDEIDQRADNQASEGKLDQLADVYIKAGKLDSAEKALKQSVEIKTASSGPTCEFLITTLDRYAHLMDVKNDAARASQYRKEAKAIRDKFGIVVRTPI